ncbi:hypothetical protein QOY93_04860 [Leclercia adecarboxylata]|nr:hypothetical protein [Leclercia adecarboxylata]
MYKYAAVAILFISLNSYGNSDITVDASTLPDIKKSIDAEHANTGFKVTNADDFINNSLTSLNKINDSNFHSVDAIFLKQHELEKEIENLKDSNKFDYAVWASILLGCVTIIITLISVILAMISIVGYRNFKKNIEQRVQNISSTIAKDETTKQIDAVAKKELARLIDEGALTNHLESAVDLVFLRYKGRPEDINDGFNKYPELDEEEQEK